MTAVYILRHPQTTWNVAHRYQGRLDAPLSELGRDQLALTEQAFQDEPLDIVYSSPLTRASVLAQAVAEAAGVSCCLDSRLSEIAMGPWEGLTRQEIIEQFPELFRLWDTRPDKMAFPQGETVENVASRARSALQDIFTRHPKGNVCVVTHSAVVQTMIMPTLGMEHRYLHRLSVKNASITTICGNEVPGRLQTFNAVDHLYRSAVESASALGCGTLEPRRRAS